MSEDTEDGWTAVELVVEAKSSPKASPKSTAPKPTSIPMGDQIKTSARIRGDAAGLTHDNISVPTRAKALGVRQASKASLITNAPLDRKLSAVRVTDASACVKETATGVQAKLIPLNKSRGPIGGYGSTNESIPLEVLPPAEDEYSLCLDESGIRNSTWFEHTLVTETHGDGVFDALWEFPHHKREGWNPDGLSEDNAASKLIKYGPNMVTPRAQSLPVWKKIILHMFEGWSPLLWFACLVSFIAYLSHGGSDDLWIGLILLVVLSLSGYSDYISTEAKQPLSDQFNQMIPESVIAMRDGVERRIPSTTLVPGDVVRVQMGDKIPADLLLLKVHDFKVNNSALTGEPEPLNRTNYPTDPDFMETQNIAFFGTFCEQGSCTAVVLRTGGGTRMAQITEVCTMDDEAMSAMDIQMQHLIRMVSMMAVGVAVMVFVLSLFNEGLLAALIMASTAVIAVVPLGMLATSTLILAGIANSIAEKNVMVKNGDIIHTLGKVNTILAEKTVPKEALGVSTPLRARRGRCGSTRFQTCDEKYADPMNWPSSYGNGSKEMVERDYQNFYHYVPFDRATNLPVPFEKVKDRIQQAFDMGGRLFSKSDEVMKWRDSSTSFRPTKYGNATDSGLFKFGETQTSQLYSSHMENPESLLGVDDDGSLLTQYQTDWEKIDELPFNSMNKFMVTVHQVPQVSADKGELRNKLIAAERKALLDSAGLTDDPTEEYVVLMMKGAAEKVVAKCSTTLINGKQIAPKLYDTMTRGKISNERKLQDCEQPTDSVSPVLGDLRIHTELMPAGVCDTLENDTEKVFTDVDCNTLHSWQFSLAVEGERVLGFSQLVTTKKELLAAGITRTAGGYTEFRFEDHDAMSALGLGYELKDQKMAWTFLGFISLVDPPRDGVAAMVEQCHAAPASIQVMMVTGDHPMTAKSIASRIGIVRGNTWVEFERSRRAAAGEDPDLILESDMFGSYKHHEWFGLQRRYPEVEAICVFSPLLPEFNDDDWRYCLRLDQVVFARTQPEQKKEVVRNLQRLHELNADALDQLKLCRSLLHSMTMRAMREASERIREEPPYQNGAVQKGYYVPTLNSANLDAKLEQCRATTIANLPLRLTELANKLEKNTKEELIAEIDELFQREELSANQQKVVAVTGSGVCDTPAIKAADCGIALGITGADVVKENADVILLDDSICSIVQTIEEGRMMLDKVQRLFVYALSSSTPQLTAVTLTVVLGIPLPLPAIMMFWIGLVLNTLLGSTLVDLRPESDALCTPIIGDEIASGRVFRFAYCQIGLIQTLAAVGSYMLVFSHHGISLSDLRGTASQYTDQNFKHVCGLDYDSRLELLASAQTAYLVTLTVMQLANSVGCRTKICAGPTSLISLDKSIVLGLLKAFGVTLLVVYLPILQGLVGTRSAGLSVWSYSAMCALFALSLDEIRKYALRKERSQPDSAQAMGSIERWASY